MENLRQALREQRVSKVSTAKGYNSYFKEAIKTSKLSKEDLIDEVVLLAFKDRLKVEPSVESFKKNLKEINLMRISIGNAIDTAKSNSATHNKGYYLEGLRLLKDQDLYHLEIIK